MSDVYVFINYRREDSAGHAGRLHDDLARRFSPDQVFIDLADIPAGVDFARSIDDAVARCTALVSLVGPRWLTAANADGGRRLDDPNDYVRLEIEAALKRDVLVIPILLQDARMPRAADLPASLRPLARRNSMQMRDASWRSDFEALATGLTRAAAASGAAGVKGESEAFWRSAPAEVELPYLGLRPFEEQDARFFFGREDDVSALVERVKGGRFLAVFGPSGSGKSSLVRAGLVSAIRSGAIKGSGGWPIEIVRPGPRPLETLAARLHRLNPARPMADLVDGLAADPRTLHLETTAIVADHPPETRFVWLIDQAEELFTLSHDEEQRRAAIANLVGAASVPGGPATVVFAMRADFYQRCAAHPELAAAISDSQYLVSPLSEAGLRRAIEEPARAVGLEFEPGLVDTIVADVTSQPGGLPLLEHALLELFQRRRGVTMTLEGYRATGGVEGALAKRAESVYAELGDEEQGVVRRVMLRLTQPGEGTVDTRRRSSLRDLPAGVGEAEPVRYVVGELADARLLTVGASEEGGEPVVEIAHEALIRAWPRVREWIEQDREALVVHRRIADAAAEWERLGGSEEVLLRAVRLAEAKEWRGRHADLLNDAERRFIDASVDHAEADVRARERRRRRIYALSASLTAFFVVLSGAALLAWRDSSALLDRAVAAESAANDTIEQLQAKQAELDQQRRIAVGRSLLASARADGTTFNLGLLLGLEARRLAGPEANEHLLEQVHGWAPLRATRQVTGIEDEATTASSPDGVTLAIARDLEGRTEISLHDIATGAERSLAEMAPLHRLAFSPDGSILATSGSDGQGRQGVYLWPVAGGAATILPTQFPSDALEFSADGRRIATEASPDGSALVVWEVRTATELLRVEVDRAIEGQFLFGSQPLASYALNGSGTRLAVERDVRAGDVRVDVWDVATGRIEVVSEPEENISGGQAGLTFSGHIDVLAGSRSTTIGSGDDFEVRSSVQVWDLSGGDILSERVHIGEVLPTVIALAPDGSSFAAAGNGTLVVSETLDRDGLGYTTRPLPFHDVAGLWFTDDGGSLVAHDGGGTVATWTTIPGPSTPTAAQPLPASGSLGLRAIAPDGRRAVSEIQSGIVPGELERLLELVDVESGERRRLDWADGRAVAFSPDGSLVVASGPSDLHVLRLAAGTDWTEDVTLPVTDAVAAAVSHDASLIAVATALGPGGLPGVQVWDLASRTELARVSLAVDPTAVTFTPDDRRLLVAATTPDRTRHLTLTMAVGDLAGTISTLTSGPSVIDALWAGPDDSAIGLSAPDLVVRWDLATGLLTAAGVPPRAAQAAGESTTSDIGAFVLAPNGQFVASGAGRLWTWSAAEFGSQHLRPIETLACALAGRNLAQVEWAQYLPDEPYRATCPEYPPGG